MERLNEDISVEKKVMLISKLYKYIGRDSYLCDVEYHTKTGVLTSNRGRDGKLYFWFLDEVDCVCIDMDGNILDARNDDDKKMIEENFC